MFLIMFLHASVLARSIAERASLTRMSQKWIGSTGTEGLSEEEEEDEEDKEEVVLVILFSSECLGGFWFVGIPLRSP